MKSVKCSMQQMLALKCYAMYGGIGFIVIAGMLLSNKYISHATSEQFQRTLLGVGAGYALILAILVLYTHIRLAQAARLTVNQPTGNQASRIWLHVTSMPNEIFWVYVITGFTIAQVYRLYTTDLSTWTEAELLLFWKGLCFDASTFLAFAMIHYSLLRWILRRELKRLHLLHITQPRFFNTANRIKFIVICGLLYMQVRVFWYLYQSIEKGITPNWSVFIAISAIIMLVALLAVYITSSYLMADLKRMKEYLIQLEMNCADRLTPLPIVSPYEAGQLTLTFNYLQEQFSEEYVRLQEEIKLARTIHEQFFPDMHMLFGCWEITGKRDAQFGSSNSFFHIYDQKAQRVVMLGGKIAGDELPATLVMSVMLMMFRTHAEAYYAADAILYRLKQQLIDVLQDDMLLHAGVVTIDLKQDRLEWVLSGQVRCMILDDKGETAYAAGSNPIGSTIMSSYTNGFQSLHAVQKFELQYDTRDQSSDVEQSSYARHQENAWYPVLTVCRTKGEAL